MTKLRMGFLLPLAISFAAVAAVFGVLTFLDEANDEAIQGRVESGIEGSTRSLLALAALRLEVAQLAALTFRCGESFLEPPCSSDAQAKLETLEGAWGKYVASPGHASDPQLSPRVQASLARLSGRLRETSDGNGRAADLRPELQRLDTTLAALVKLGVADQGRILAELADSGAAATRKAYALDGAALFFAVAMAAFALRRTQRYTDLRERQMRALSMTDELTSLNNRRGLLAGVQQLVTLGRADLRVGVFFADIDGLKEINDTFGHDTGNAAIRDLASLLRKTFRDEDLIARIGGDEFVVVVAGNITPESMAGWSRRLFENLAALNEAQRPYRLGLSVGTAWFDPTASEPFEDVLKRSDAAMYRNKRGRRPAVRLAGHVPAT